MVVVVSASAMVAAARQAAPASFEAASIKRNASRDTRTRFETPPGRLNAVNVPLRFVIRQAYRMSEARIIGGPSWLDSDRFDILATAASGTTADGIRDMLRSLLQERFRLALHMETREMAVYDLVVARAGGALGPNLRRSSTDCSGKASSMVGGRVQCGLLVSQGSGSASLRGGGTTIASFTRLLGDFLDRPVNDRTGLAGAFDLELQFTAPASATPGAPVPGGLATATGLDDIPTVFTAIQEQMGLRLNPQQGRADVLVIDSVSSPTTD